MTWTRLHQILLGVIGLTAFAAGEANAIPLFTRQTGQQCGACHTAPPELTPFGRRFMLGGFTMTGGEGRKIALSGMVEAGLTHTSADVDGKRKNLDENDNLRVQRISAYTGGAITDTVGGFAQAVYSPITERAQIGNLDLRHADSYTVGDHDLLFGVTLNNNPGFQDPWGSTVARTWPWARSSAAPMPANRGIMEGTMAQRAVGAGAYGMLDDSLYVELAGYGPLTRDAQTALGVDPMNARIIDDLGLYGRVAYEHLSGKHSMTVGASTFASDFSLPGDVGHGSDSVLNIGADALYQYSAAPHEIVLRTSLAHESWDSGTSQAQGFASDDDNELTSFKASGMYLFSKVYAGSVGYFRSWGSSDALFFNTSSGRPDTEGFQFEVFTNPLTKNPPSWYPWMRARIGLQYTHYTKFDGGDSNYDGLGRDASDNDTIFLYTLMAF